MPASWIWLPSPSRAGGTAWLHRSFLDPVFIMISVHFDFFEQQLLDGIRVDVPFHHFRKISHRVVLHVGNVLCCYK